MKPSEGNSQLGELLRTIQRWLAPPVFPDDPDKTRRAALISSLLLTLLALMAVIFAGTLVGGKTPRPISAIDALAPVLYLVLHRWIRHGKVQLAGIGLMACGLTIATINVAILGTIRTPTTTVFLLLVIAAGLLFDVRGIVAMTALCSLAVAGLVAAENAGWLPRPDYTVTITQWITFTALFAWVGTLTFASLQTTRQALARAESELAERKHAEESLRQRSRDLDTLNRVSHLLASTLDLAQVMERLMQAMTEVLGVAGSSAWLWSQDEPDQLVCQAAFHPGLNVKLVGLRMQSGQGVAGAVAQGGESTIVNNTANDPRFFPGIDRQTGFQTETLLAVPLRTRDRIIGMLEAVNKPGGKFDERDVVLAETLAGSAAIAIENAQLYLQAQQEIAERKRAEAALEEERALLAQRVQERTIELSQTNLDLARANRLKDEFLATMSHELRTPLTAVLGLSESLQEGTYGPLNERQLRSLHTIEASGRHLLTLITDILDLTKIGAGKLDVELDWVLVEPICQTSVQIVRPAAQKKSIELTTTHDGAVKLIQADERRLKQILVNLLDNAIKFTPERGQAGLEIVGDTEQQVMRFTVWDTGIGIAPDDLRRLLQGEPFTQLDSRLARKYNGTGLGLSLVKRLAELHHGCLTAESVPGQGSRFTVSLPWRETTSLESST